MKDICKLVNSESVNKINESNTDIKIVEANNKEVINICAELCSIYSDVLDKLANISLEIPTFMLVTISLTPYTATFSQQTYFRLLTMDTVIPERISFISTLIPITFSGLL